MKIRKGFISNSSSTSFVCDVCGEDVSGMDMGLEDAGMYQCENDHTFCREHVLDEEALEKRLSGGEGEDEDTLYDLIYELPEQYCPLCHFEQVSDADLITYLLKEAGKQQEDVAKEMKDKFPNYTAFREYVK